MMDTNIRLSLCNILIILNSLVSLGGVLIVLTTLGLAPIEIARSIATVIPLNSPDWVTFTVGELVILGLIFMIYGSYGMEKFWDERKLILKEIADNAIANKNTP